ncbi:MAG TPA: diaminopimelate epimerase [Anaerohalosphaeraceae bacterium]|nr:diaminopimelate epimerase [Anaerohalosphaeraceae bacterium]HOM77281.1 diaminopimelate epimerase [Anaerohalosphaeraceae bacterium]HPO70686.1 diaminopimelate epimerase [Anaerohalosphaeraceae bacterium]HRS72281.1 diaminopimelate epimerase [Anaerohalosphaeraceae bacterium]
MMEFTKMHGLGNDYVYVNCFSQTVQNPAQLAVKVSDRHFGIGSDGLILICPSTIADAKMRMFNADGSEAQMCGNGIRCVAKYVYDHHLARTHTEFSVPGLGTFASSLRIETGRGVLTVGLDIDKNDKVRQVCVNMGQPILEASRIPVAGDAECVIDQELAIEGQTLSMTCVSMGNPHAVFFCEDLQSIELAHIGPLIEHHELFPQRINVHFVKSVSPEEFIMKTWERGSGITMACGTGACACAVAGVLTGRCQRRVRAHLPGGDLDLYWSEQDNCVYMTGPAAEVYSGIWPD